MREVPGLETLWSHLCFLQMVWVCVGIFKEWTGTSSEVMWTLNQSVVVKKQLVEKANLSVYWSPFVQILSYGHQIWITTFWGHEPEISFIDRVAGLSFIVGEEPCQFAERRIFTPAVTDCPGRQRKKLGQMDFYLNTGENLYTPVIENSV